MTDLTALNPLLEVLRLQAQALNAFAQQSAPKECQKKDELFLSPQWHAREAARAEMKQLKRLLELCENHPNPSSSLQHDAQQAQERIRIIKAALKSRSPLPGEPSNLLFHTRTHCNSSFQHGRAYQVLGEYVSFPEFHATYTVSSNPLASWGQGAQQ